MLDISEVTDHLLQHGGRFALGYTEYDGKWASAIEWGKEDEESSFPAAAAYGVGDTPAEAIQAAVADAGLGSTSCEQKVI